MHGMLRQHARLKEIYIATMNVDFGKILNKTEVLLTYQFITSTWTNVTSSNIGTERKGMGGQWKLGIECDAWYLEAALTYTS